MDVYLFIFTVFVYICTVNSYEFDTKGGEIYYKAPGRGSKVELPCALTGAVSRFSVNVVWRKIQDTNNKPTGVPVSNNKYKESPFGSDDRIKFNQQGADQNRHDLSLIIEDLKPEDSGSYRCEVYEGQALKHDVRHKLYVLSEVETVRVNGDPNGQKTSYSFNSSAITLKYDADRSGYFECVVSGGYPAPTVKVHVGNPERQIVGNAMLKSDVGNNIALIGDVEGMQKYSSNIRIFSKNFRLNGRDDGTELKCVASVNGTWKEKRAAAVLSIVSKPVIVEKECAQEVAVDNSKTFQTLTCLVGGQPIPSVTWEAMRTGQQMTSNSGPVDFLEATTEIKGGRVVAKLRISDMSSKSFQEYKLKAKNSRGEVMKIINFTPEPGMGYVGTAAVLRSAFTASILTLLVLLLTTLFSLQS